MVASVTDLEKQKQQLELEADIAEARVRIIEANVRRMTAQTEYTKLRTALASKRK